MKDDINLVEAYTLRQIIRERAPCSTMAEHHWVTVTLGGVLIFVICRECGRYPLEAMDLIPIERPDET